MMPAGCACVRGRRPLPHGRETAKTHLPAKFRPHALQLEFHFRHTFTFPFTDKRLSSPLPFFAQTILRASQPSNTLFPMSLRVSGRVTSSTPLCEKQLSPMLSTPSGISMRLKSLQPLNVRISIFVRVEGSVMLSIALLAKTYPLNYIMLTTSLSPSSVRPSFSCTTFSYLQAKKAHAPIFLKLAGQTSYSSPLMEKQLHPIFSRQFGSRTSFRS